jgi:radical SAM protein with 4Fe4S-binding SPASM domain
MNLLNLQASIYRLVVASYQRVAPILSRFMNIPPLRLTLVLTNKCNLSCGHCFQKEGLNKKTEGELSTDEWIRVIESTSPLTIVDLIGGEALLHRDFDKILEACRKKKLMLSLTTNATLLNDRAVEKIIESRVHYLMISIDGLGKSHDEYRGRAGLFEKALEAIERLNKAKKQRGSVRPFICIKTLLMNQNVGKLPEMIRFFQNVSGVDELKFHFPTLNENWNSLSPLEDLDAIFDHDSNQYVFTPEATLEFSRRLPELKALMSETRLRVTIGPELSKIEDYVLYLEDNSRFKVGRCGEPMSNFSILPDGNLIPCLAFRIGSIREFDFNVNRVLFNDRHKSFLKRQGQDGRSNACLSCALKGHSRK